jgi:hypothetical protein
MRLENERQRLDQERERLMQEREWRRDENERYAKLLSILTGDTVTGKRR